MSYFVCVQYHRSRKSSRGGEAAVNDLLHCESASARPRPPVRNEELRAAAVGAIVTLAGWVRTPLPSPTSPLLIPVFLPVVSMLVEWASPPSTS